MKESWRILRSRSTFLEGCAGHTARSVALLLAVGLGVAAVQYRSPQPPHLVTKYTASGHRGSPTRPEWQPHYSSDRGAPSPDRHPAAGSSATTSAESRDPQPPQDSRPATSDRLPNTLSVTQTPASGAMAPASGYRSETSIVAAAGARDDNDSGQESSGKRLDFSTASWATAPRSPETTNQLAVMEPAQLAAVPDAVPLIPPQDSYAASAAPTGNAIRLVDYREDLPATGDRVDFEDPFGPRFEESVPKPISDDELLVPPLPEDFVDREPALLPPTDEEEGQAFPNPAILRPPAESSILATEPPANLEPESDEVFRWTTGAPLGFSGPSSIVPTEDQTDSHFVPMEDRWRAPFPDWDRYDADFPLGEDYPYKKGHWWDPYNQNVLKGDYPIIGQHTFFDLKVESITLFEGRQVPTATTPFESTINPFQEEFFGDPDQYFFNQLLFVSFELFHGNPGFKPVDWRVRLTPAFNANHLNVDELGIILPDVREGTVRTRDDGALEEWFVETKIADLGADYDFVSARAGSQFFTSDFRGFIFFDTNRAVRLFGTRLANRDQFNFIWFDQTEKQTQSQLNTWDDRHQNTFIANYYRQDVVWPGYTAQLSFHYNRDQADFLLDKNNFLVRPDPVGVFAPHDVTSYYIGWTGDGHINRLNITHAFYLVRGNDELNPIAGKRQDIDAQMAAVELSIDRDWARFRTSFLWASGDSDPSDDDAEGFDAIFPNMNFAGGEFSYWQRQAIQLFGVQLVNDRSLVPSLRSNRIQGQTNFVNPGLYLFNFGMDADITPKLKAVSNVNFLWFDSVETLKLFTFSEDIDDFIGTDLSLGLEYRPLLNDNIEIIGGISGLAPGGGFEDLFGPLIGDRDGLFAGFLELVAVY